MSLIKKCECLRCGHSWYTVRRLKCPKCGAGVELIYITDVF